MPCDSASRGEGRRSRGHRAHALGREGERRAARFLETRGYRVLDRNVRAGGVELDLVVGRGTRVVFVEVKTRRGVTAGAPHESIDARKRARLRSGASAWLRERRSRAHSVRFDVVCFVVRGETWTCTHYEGAF